MPNAPSSSHPAAPFRLRPFPGDPAPVGLVIQGSAARDGERLCLRYELSGPLQQLQIQEPGDAPERLDDLWQSTCLECFLALNEDPGYWEANLSPAGDWNLYRLEGYRQGLAPEPAAVAPALQRLPRPDGLELVMTLTLPPRLAAAAELQLGITAVIATRHGELSYWALRHPGEQPDFHRREGFVLWL